MQNEKGLVSSGKVGRVKQMQGIGHRSRKGDPLLRRVFLDA